MNFVHHEKYRFYLNNRQYCNYYKVPAEHCRIIFLVIKFYYSASLFLFINFKILCRLESSTQRFVMYVCPSCRMEQRGSLCADFHEIWYLRIFLKYVETVQVSLKSEKYKRSIFDNTSLIFLRMRCFRHTLYRKSKHTFIFSNVYRKPFLLQDNLRNTVDPDNP